MIRGHGHLSVTASFKIYVEIPIHEAGAVISLLEALIGALGKTQLCVCLVNMAVRFVEIHRFLKPTGSLYLHCDPTGSHYLKIVLDRIFGTASVYTADQRIQ